MGESQKILQKQSQKFAPERRRGIGNQEKQFHILFSIAFLCFFCLWHKNGQKIEYYWVGFNSISGKMFFKISLVQKFIDWLWLRSQFYVSFEAKVLNARGSSGIALDCCFYTHMEEHVVNCSLSIRDVKNTVVICLSNLKKDKQSSWWLRKVVCIQRMIKI